MTKPISGWAADVSFRARLLLKLLSNFIFLFCFSFFSADFRFAASAEDRALFTDVLSATAVRTLEAGG